MASRPRVYASLSSSRRIPTFSLSLSLSLAPVRYPPATVRSFSLPTSYYSFLSLSQRFYKNSRSRLLDNSAFPSLSSRCYAFSLSFRPLILLSRSRGISLARAYHRYVFFPSLFSPVVRRISPLSLLACFLSPAVPVIRAISLTRCHVATTATATTTRRRRRRGHRPPLSAAR